MSGAAGPSDEVSITIGTAKITGWQSVQITRSVESFPNSFGFTMTEIYPADPTEVIVVPGQGICTVKIGADLVITGYVDRYSPSFSQNAHQVEITGRGLGEDLVDCSVDIVSPDSEFHNGKVSVTSAFDLAKKLCVLNSLTARIAVDDLGRAIPNIQVAPGETSYELLEKVCRYAGYLVYEDETGALVLDRVSTLKMASGFAQGVNVEAAVRTLSVDQRFTTYTIMASTVDQINESGGPTSVTSQRAQQVDTGLIAMGRKRPRVVISTQTDGNATFPQQMVDWEMARRIGRSQAVQLTCDSWRDSSDKLWQPNRLANVNLPALKLVNADWIIATVVFRKDESGTHADLTLMPPDAFSIQPTTLIPFDQELKAKPPVDPDSVN